MKVTHSIFKDKIEFKFYPTSEDTVSFVEEQDTKNKYKFGRDRCFIEVPSSVSSSLHKDVLALIVILIIDSYSNEIELDFSVSEEFANTYFKTRGKKIFPYDTKYQLRSTGAEYRPALTYSGGNDSTAALYLMPEHTRLYHVERVDVGYKMQFNPKAGVQSTNIMERRGYQVRVVRSDYLYVRDYPGQMSHSSPAIAALLWGDHDKIDSIASGDTFEEFYNLTYSKFSSKPNQVYLSYRDLFDVVGMPLMNLTAGISEVVTQRIVASNNDETVAQACVAGDELGTPCGKCVKCFRKGFLSAVIKKKKLSEAEEINLLNNRHAYDALMKYPVRYQILYAYIFNNYSGMTNNPLIRHLRKKMSLSPGYAPYLDRWYSPSLEFIPNKYKDEVSNNIHKYAEDMDFKDRISLFLSRVTCNRWNPLLRLRHFKFMEKYAEKTQRYELRMETSWSEEIRVGCTYTINLFRREGCAWKDVTCNVNTKWGTSDGRIGYVKNGKLIAVRAGRIRVRAHHYNNIIDEWLNIQ